MATSGRYDAHSVIVLEVIESVDPPVHDESDAAHGDPNQERQCPLPELCHRIILLCPVYLELLLHIIFLNVMMHTILSPTQAKVAQVRAITTMDSRLMMLPMSIMSGTAPLGRSLGTRSLPYA